ncbi:LON peptidase substrate-binding domain-containing protein [Oscillatoria amoena NRMC-F 0135]|nr:LON peptidase substrate-binding domain-containing protein [Oscillatoria amoena NRMC-F 0135]
MKIDSPLPFMVLTGVTLFPQGLLPLYIFEPRYRKMLQECLDGARIFGVVSLDHLSQNATVSDQSDIIAGVGLIRACVGQEDGTSQLILQGISRVRLTRFVQTTPILVSEVEPLASINCDNLEVDALAGRLREIIHEMTFAGQTIPAHVLDYLDKTRDPDALSDLISYLILKRADYRRDILQTLDLKERYRKLLHMVPEELKVVGFPEDKKPKG